MIAETTIPTYQDQIPLPPENSIPTYQDRDQLDFTVRMHQQYLAVKGVPDVGVRRLHYYIVSLPASERVMPARSGTKLYTNTTLQYQDLSGLLVRARTEGRIDPDQIIDDKNPALIPMLDREPANTTWTVGTFSARPLPELGVDVMPEWENWLWSFQYDPHVLAPVFNNQKYRVVVVIEKATSKSKLIEICQRYGADLLVFSGQFSVTRVYDICNRARDEERPILLLYISDLDVGGWGMPTAFLSRIQEIYPNDDHKMVRIALTREQATRYKLPKAFDPDDKKYNKTQIANFINDSGGRDCIELDALDESTLLDLLEAELRKHTGKQEDAAEYATAVDEAQDTKNAINPSDAGIGDLRTEYEAIKAGHNRIAKELESLAEKYRNEISDLNVRRFVIESRAKGAILDTYGFEEYIWEV